MVIVSVIYVTKVIKKKGCSTIILIILIISFLMLQMNSKNKYIIYVKQSKIKSYNIKKNKLKK